ncbi:MAG: hypothetical protein JWP13_284 [Candidatus Saccharibacteria bacterium]|nr:hypothetical protein [Candidatus Saccharibacteria bacterium]
MNFLGRERRQRREECKRSLAMDDPRVRGAAGLIALSDTVDITPQSFDAMVENLALVRERYDLDPDVIAMMLSEFEPEIAVRAGLK